MHHETCWLTFAFLPLQEDCKSCVTGLQNITVLTGDMSVFPTAKNLVSWAGCCPRNDQSNQKIKSTRISRAGYYFKPVLVQIANALIKSKKHPEITNRYKRIKARCVYIYFSKPPHKMVYLLCPLFLGWALLICFKLFLIHQ